MWAFALVSLAICTPAVRALLERVFADLAIVFVNWLGVVAVATCAAFVGALVFEATSSGSIAGEDDEEEDEEEHNGGASVSVMRRALPAYKNRWAASLLAASVVVPLGVSATSASVSAWDFPITAVGASRRLANMTVPWTLANNATTLAALEKLYTTCNYSGKKECINNPQKVPELGEYKRGPGRCVAFDSAYVNVTFSASAIPNRYLPIAGEDAYKEGFGNKFSEWSTTNQEQFQVDCPLLYNETIAKGAEYLCCTEAQYGGLQTQVRMIPGQCTACKENLRNVWCQMACNPSNSQYIEPVQVRIMKGDDAHPNDIYPALEEIDYYVGKDWIRDIYDFCAKDSSFSLLCSAAQNCTDGYGLLNFMGEYKLNSLGSPLQINVKTMDQFPDAVQKEKFCACGSNSTDCFSPQDSRLENCFGVCGSVCAITANDKRTYTPSCYGAKAASASNDSATKTEDMKWNEFSSYLAANLVLKDFTALNYFLAIFGGVVAIVLVAGFIFVSIHRRKHTGGASRGSVVALTGDQGTVERRLSAVDDWICVLLKKWGLFLAKGKRPYLVSSIVLAVVIALSLGLTQIEVETMPVKLWVATSSRPYKERARYGEIFTPFYRTEQVVMVPKDGGVISRSAYLRDAIRIQENVAKVFYGPQNGTFPDRVGLNDICWKATGTSCTINAITQYFQNRLDHFDFYQKYDLAESHFSTCIYSPTNQDIQTCNSLRAKLKPGDSIPASMSDCPCLSAFGSPMNLYNVYLGGFPKGAEENTPLYLQSKALLTTTLVYNYYDEDDNEPAVNWEHEFISYMKKEAAENTLFNLYFMAETSVHDEIKRSSSGDMLPVVLSYSLMIIYVSLGINRWKMDKSFFRTSKISVGFLGIVCIMFAVSTTIGIFMWCGAKLQLVIMEVVPFLTLAIGVDNIFLLVHAVEDKHALIQREKPELFENLRGNKQAIEEVVALLVSEGVSYIGPSIFMASCAESIAFAFGCISPMPAVLWFAAFSAVAVIVNLTLQMTLLLTIITLDKRRELSGKYDIACCVAASDSAHPLMAVEPKTPEGGAATAQAAVESEGGGLHFFDRCIDAYTSFLAFPVVKLIVLLAFLALSLTSIASIEKIEHGLPQKESMPSDSYLISYFNTIDEYLATGPPIFFVVEGGYGRNPKNFNLNDQSVEAKFCKSKDFCDEFSIAKIVDALANDMDSEVTHFAKGITYSWLDDFWSFINPDAECCRVGSKTGAYLPINSDNVTYSNLRKQNPTCLPVSSSAPPVPEDHYMSLFSMFATSPAGSLCSYGGASIYRGQFSIDEKPVPVLTDSSPQVVLNSTGFGKNISAFSYMVQSTANPTQRDFIDLYKQGRRAAEWISKKTGIDVWVYSFFYVFFDQYLTVVEDTYKLVGLALAAIFLIHAVYFTSLFYPLVVTLAATNIVIQVMGLMKPLDIMLNGLSMVNLIIAAGISVEFCGHFVRMFAKANGTGDQRAKTALRKVLTSVLFGITITKVVGLSALTLADSRVFQKYYFRMYMTVVVYGVLNGMVLLPVLLSVVVDVKSFLQRRKSEKNLHAAAGDAHESPMFQRADSAKVPAPLAPSTRTSESHSG